MQRCAGAVLMDMEDNHRTLISQLTDRGSSQYMRYIVLRCRSKCIQSQYSLGLIHSELSLIHTHTHRERERERVDLFSGLAA